MIFFPKKVAKKMSQAKISQKPNLCWSLFMPFYKDIYLLTYLFIFVLLILSSLINIFIVFLTDFPPIVSIEENCSKFGEFGKEQEGKRRVLEKNRGWLRFKPQAYFFCYFFF